MFFGLLFVDAVSSGQDPIAMNERTSAPVIAVELDGDHPRKFSRRRFHSVDDPSVAVVEESGQQILPYFLLSTIDIGHCTINDDITEKYKIS